MLSYIKIVKSLQGSCKSYNLHQQKEQNFMLKNKNKNADYIIHTDKNADFLIYTNKEKYLSS